MATSSSQRRHEDAYRALTRLYPADLRVEHGAEMVQVFGELLRERGRRAWALTLLDLAVSLPRTHLEITMSTLWSSTASVVAVTALAAVAVVAFLAFGPPAIPLAIVLVAAAVAQRSRLARAVDGGPSPSTRAPLAVLVAAATILVSTLASWSLAVDRGDGFGDGTLLVYNLLGAGSVAALVASAAVLLRRRSRSDRT